jgi:di/tricarboxylate transporter
LTVDAGGGSLWLIYVFTLIVTELLTNNAAAALAFPLAFSTAAVYKVRSGTE